MFESKVKAVRMMSGCSSNQDLVAYHDGELDAARRAAFELHLNGCAQCAAELAELRGMSALFESGLASRSGLSQMGWHRLHGKVDEAMEAGVLRFARVLSAVAACVLATGSVWLATASPKTVETMQPVAPPWADVSMSSDADSSTGAYTTPAAAWYLSDNGSHGEDAP